MRLDRLLPILVVVALVAGCGPSASRRADRGTAEPAKASDQKFDPVTAAQTNVSLGRAYLEQGKYKIALEKLEKALELDPKSTDAHTVIAVLYEKINQGTDAAAHYKRAVELSPKSGETNNNNGAYLCRQQRYAEADQYFAKAFLDPFYATPAVAWGNRGSCAMAWGNLELAEESFRRAIEIDPKQTDTLFRLAQVASARKDFLKARAFIQRYESLAKPSAESTVLAMNIEHGLGDAKAELEYRSRLLTDFPDSEQAQKMGGAKQTP